MNNTDWLDIDIPDPTAEQTEESEESEVLCFDDAHARAVWEDMDMIKCVVVYSPSGSKQYGERHEFGPIDAFAKGSKFKIVQYERFDRWIMYEHGDSPRPNVTDIVEVELAEYEEYSYLCDQAGSIDWSNVVEYRILLDPEND